MNLDALLNTINKTIDESSEYDDFEDRTEKINFIEKTLDKYLKDEIDVNIVKSEIKQIF